MRLTPLLRLRQTTSLLESLTIPAAPAQPTVVSSLPYNVSRTGGNNIPVYKRTRAGGSHKSTIVQRIQGDSLKLRDDIRTKLGVPADHVSVNPRTGHVYVKGEHIKQIKDILADMGF